jgi:tetratricopeptide (TPR) repeat protein
VSNHEPKVYISYAWGGESERIANELDTYLQSNGITLVRDKRNLGFKGMIRDFMERIGRGHAVVLIISDKYLKSSNCMYELVEIAKNKDMYDRIFPIVLGDADIYDPVKRINYRKHWDNKFNELNAAIKSLDSPVNLQGMNEELSSYDEIRDNISKLTFMLKDMNTLTSEMHEKSDFSNLISELKKRLGDVEKENSQVNHSTTEPANDFLKTAHRRLGHPAKIYHRLELEKQVLESVLGDEHPVTVMHGLPGSGKTILLGEIASKIHQTYPNIFTLHFANVLAVEPAYFVEELNEFLTKLNIGVDSNSLKTQDWHRSLESLSEQLSHVQHFILLLDEVDQAPPRLIDSLMDLLPQTKMMMTARSRVIPKTKAQFINIPPFQERESIEFLNMFGGSPGEGDGSLNWLVRIPKKIKENPQLLKQLIDNLGDVPLELLLMDGIDNLAQDPSMLTKKLIQDLNSDTLRVLSLIILLEGLDLSYSLKTLEITHQKGLVKALPELLGKSLIYRQGDSYRIPSLVRESAVEKIPKDINDEIVQQIGQAIQAVSSIFQKQYGKSSEVVPIIANFFLHLSELKYDDRIINLATDELIEAINRQGFWKEYRLILRITFEAAKQVKDQNAIATTGLRIVRKSFQLRDMQSSRQTLTELENTLQVVPGTQLFAELLSHRALFTEMDGNSKGALDELNESFQIHKKLGNTESVSVIQNLIGNIHLRQKEITKARKSYKMALLQHDDDQILSKHALEAETNIAVCDFIEKKLNNAQARLRSIIEKCHTTGYLAGLPRAYYFLALVLDLDNQLEDALHFAELAADLAPKSEHFITRGAQLLIWKIKDQNPQKKETLKNEG